jgi:calcineurin-like phosphoesterase family protein
MTIWFTSDLHFGHANIIKYCKRPYSNVDDMNEALIDNWNSIVQKDDIVYVLGDFAYGRHFTPDKAARVLQRLSGIKVLIAGNHDEDNLRSSQFRSKFEEIHSLFELKIPPKRGERHGTMIVMCHYPMRKWNQSHRGSIHLFGHEHGSSPEDKASRSMDVGVDCHNYYPISFEEVLEKMETKTWKPKRNNNEE